MVPIALSVTLLGYRVTPGAILLSAILLSSFVSAFILKKNSHHANAKNGFINVACCNCGCRTLTISSIYGIFDVSGCLFFPILLFFINDRIVALFLEGNLSKQSRLLR